MDAEHSGQQLANRARPLQKLEVGDNIILHTQARSCWLPLTWFLPDLCTEDLSGA